jgi:hypothetical protein
MTTTDFDNLIQTVKNDILTPEQKIELATVLFGPPRFRFTDDMYNDLQLVFYTDIYMDTDNE